GWCWWPRDSNRHSYFRYDFACDLQHSHRTSDRCDCFIVLEQSVQPDLQCDRDLHCCGECSCLLNCDYYPGRWWFADCHSDRYFHLASECCSVRFQSRSNPIDLVDYRWCCWWC